MIKYSNNSCRVVSAGWYFKIVASSGSTAPGSARVGRPMKETEARNGRYRRRRDRKWKTRGRREIENGEREPGDAGRGWKKRGETGAARRHQPLTRQAKSPRSSKCRGYSTHVSSLPPTTALALVLSSSTRSFNPFHRRVKRRMEEPGRSFLASLSVLCFTFQYFRYSLISFVSFGHFSLLSSSPPCLRHENGRSTHLGTTGGLLKNALAPSVNLLRLSLSLSSPLVARASLRGKCFRPWKCTIYPDRASGRGSPNRYPRIHRACSIHMCVYMYVTSLLHVFGRWAMGISLWNTCG